MAGVIVGGQSAFAANNSWALNRINNKPWYSDKDFFETKPNGTVWYNDNIKRFRHWNNIVQIIPESSGKYERWVDELRGVPKWPDGTSRVGRVKHYRIKAPAKYNETATFWVPGQDLWPNPDGMSDDDIRKQINFFWYPPFVKGDVEKVGRGWNRTTYVLFRSSKNGKPTSFETYIGTTEDDSRLVFRQNQPYDRSWITGS